MDKEEEQRVLLDTLSSQVKDPYYERNLRVLQQVQEKRATLLGFHCQDDRTVDKTFGRTTFGRQNDTSLDQNSKSPENSIPPPLQFSTDLALTTDVRGHLVKPKSRHVSVVRPVQYPDRKICHPVPQALRRPPGNSPADSADSRRLPPKKRPYIPNHEDTVPPSQDDRVASLGPCETSAFCTFLPDHVMNDYYQQLRNKKARLAGEVTEYWNLNAAQNNRSISLKELDALTYDLIDDDAELDREVAAIFSPSPELKTDYCHSPNEPWIPDMTDDIIAETEMRDHDMIRFIRKINPVIISLSPGNSPSSPITVTSSLGNNTDRPITVSSSLENSPSSPITIVSSHENSPCHPVIISPTHGRQQFIEHLSSMVSSGNSTASVQIERPTYAEPGIVSTDHRNASEDSSSRPKRSMEELRRMVLTTDRSADCPSPDRFTQTEEEQFAEILEDFLEENKCLPPDIRDVILDMLNKTRDTVVEQKEGILYTAEIFMGESDDDSSVEGFDRAADDEVMQLINEIDLPDPSSFNTRESLEDVLIDMLTNERATMDGSVEGTVYTTDAFIRAEDQQLLEEFERATEGGLPSEDICYTESFAPIVNNRTEFPKSKFEEVKCVDVEMESTGQGINDEIADFFGYDGYTDYLSYDYSSDGRLQNPNIPNTDYNFIGF